MKIQSIIKTLKEFISEFLENTSIKTVEENQEQAVNNTSDETVAENAENIVKKETEKFLIRQVLSSCVMKFDINYKNESINFKNQILSAINFL